MKELIDKHASINLFKLLNVKKKYIYCEDNWKTTLGWEGQLEIRIYIYIYIYQSFLKLKNSIFTGT